MKLSAERYINRLADMCTQGYPIPNFVGRTYRYVVFVISVRSTHLLVLLMLASIIDISFCGRVVEQLVAVGDGLSHLGVHSSDIFCMLQIVSIMTNGESVRRRVRMLESWKIINNQLQMSIALPTPTTSIHPKSL